MDTLGPGFANVNFYRLKQEVIGGAQDQPISTINSDKWSFTTSLIILLHAAYLGFKLTRTLHIY